MPSLKVSYSMKARPQTESVGVLQRQAVSLHEQGRHNDSLAAVRKILEKEPENVDALAFAGGLLANLGDYERGAGLLQRALALNPKHFDAANNLGGVLAHTGDLDGAINAFQQALKLRPGSGDARNNLDHVREVRDTLDGRVAEARAQIERDPTAARPRMILGTMLIERGRVQEALAAFLTAVRLDPGDVASHDALMRALTEVAPVVFDETLDQVLTHVLASPLTYMPPIANVLARHLLLKHGLAASVGTDALLDDAQVAALDRDPLFVDFLRQVLNTEPAMEQVLITLRRTLTERHAPDDAGLPMDLTGALAEQCFVGEYVWAATAGERDRADVYAGQAAALFSPYGAEEDDARAALLYALYRPLGGLGDIDPRIDLSGLPAPVVRVVDLTAREPAQEEDLRPRFPQVGEITDTISKDVRARYETHPYPRLAHLPRRPPLNLARDLPRRFLTMDPPAFLDGPMDVLVAGCGTGWHPLTVAMLYPGARVTAVDLSTASLAYAARMAEKHGIDNVEFRQADILNLDRLGQDFDMVEAIGVLHHMAEPVKAWKTLAGLLRPKGLMKLGLYSEKAQQIVVAAREHVAGDAEPSGPEDVREFRTKLIAEAQAAEARGEGGPWEVILQEPDFYALSTCRDMLFPAQEHRFTIPRIQAAVKETGLSFLGWELPDPSYADLYQGRFPNDRAMTILGNWDALERELPTFILRYEFWLQKPA